MVGAVYFLCDEGIEERVLQRPGDPEIIDAPPDVLFTGVEPVRPPGIVSGLLVELPEGVDEPVFDVPVEGAPLLGGEARVVDVRLRVLEVYLLVGRVEIAAEDDRLRRFEPFYVREKIRVPLHAVIEPGKTVLGVRRVDVDEEESVELEGDDPALPVVLGDSHAAGKREGLDLREHGGSRISPPVCAVPELQVSGKIDRDLLPGSLGLLEAEDVRVDLFNDVEKAVFHGSPDPVDIPRYKLHATPFKNRPHDLFSFLLHGAGS